MKNQTKNIFAAKIPETTDTTTKQETIIEPTRTDNTEELLRLKAGILNHARRRPLSDTCFSEIKKPISPKTEEAIINTLIAMKNNAKAEVTVKQVSYKLKQISEHANLANPEDVKQYIANSKLEILLIISNL